MINSIINIIHMFYTYIVFRSIYINIYIITYKYIFNNKIYTDTIAHSI